MNYTSPMNSEQPARTALLILAIYLRAASGDNAAESNYPNGADAKLTPFQQVDSTPEAFRQEALRLILGEANKVSRELHLVEKLPIEETDLVSFYITPPKVVQQIGAIGNVTTANYTYYCSVGFKFSYLARAGLDKEFARLREQGLSPISQMDTNAAYRLAVQWLADCSMDVKALDRDCSVNVLAVTPQGDNGPYFVPVYWVYWMERGNRSGSVASVQLFAPTKALLQLRVESSRYILRKPLVITNLAYLLSQTNAVIKTNLPVKR